MRESLVPEKPGATRRRLLALAGASAFTAAFPPVANARIFRDLTVGSPPIASRESFVAWMSARRPEDTRLLALRWHRLQSLLSDRDLLSRQDIRAFLLTPREEFVRPQNVDRAYWWSYLDIGYGVTIPAPGMAARMISALKVVREDRVLEIGTGSGYQAAILSNLTNQVFSVELISELSAETARIFDRLVARGYTEYEHILQKRADGYSGWEDKAPFDKIVVTCGIDHIPRPLLDQLKPGGAMVIPIGPSGRHHVFKVIKAQEFGGRVALTSADINRGKPVAFVPFVRPAEGGAVI